jgi:hypothetical protein
MVSGSIYLITKALTSSRLEQYVYREVWLTSNHKARAFLVVVSEGARALYIVKLCFALSVCLSSMVEVLTLCQNMEDLAIKSSIRYIPCRMKNPLLVPLRNLLRIKTMSTELATVAGEEHIILPEFVWFNRISQLHLNTSLISLDSVPEGLSSLENLTHLAMFWVTTRLCTSGLVQFLEKGTMVVLILWINDIVTESTIHKDLRLRGLGDVRVVLFRSCLMGEYVAAGGFWKYAERIVKWRVDNKGTCYSR